MKKEPITLTAAQRPRVEQFLSTGKAVAWTLTPAQVSLNVARGPPGPAWSTSQLVEASEGSRRTRERLCRLLREQGVDAARFHRPHPPGSHTRKREGEAEAHLVALLCGEPPEGTARWGLRLEQEPLVELEIGASVSQERARQGLKQMQSSRG
jgi:hypothetical protein